MLVHITKGEKMKKLIYIVLAIVVIAGICFAIFRAPKAHATNSPVLVAYFSATGNTAGVATRLADATGADLFEIKPESPYTPEDLNWNNEQSRSSVEMKDAGSRPAIASKIENMNQYKIVFVGFPIWWGREPSIIDTFMTSYDFAGKTVIPFATSGSSDIGNTYANLQSLAPNANVLSGKRFANDVSGEDLKTWADEFVK